MDDSLII